MAYFTDMQTEEQWIEIGVFWVIEAAAQRVHSLQSNGLTARVQTPDQTGRKGFRVEVPAADATQAQTLLAELYPVKEKDFQEHRKLDQALRQTGKRNLVLGGILVLLGLVLTLGSLVETEGWSAILLYGAVLTGLFLAMLGWIQMR